MDDHVIHKCLQFSKPPKCTHQETVTAAQIRKKERQITHFDDPTTAY